MVPTPTSVDAMARLDQRGVPVSDARWAPTQAFTHWLDSLLPPARKDQRAAAFTALAAKHKTRHEAAKAVWGENYDP
jgi:hypothetical protein